MKKHKLISTAEYVMEEPNNYVGSVFVWNEEKVKEIMQDIVNFTINLQESPRTSVVG